MKFIHFQPVFFDKFVKRDWGYLQKITHEWLQTWRPSYHYRLQILVGSSGSWELQLTKLNFEPATISISTPGFKEKYLLIFKTFSK